MVATMALPHAIDVVHAAYWGDRGGRRSIRASGGTRGHTSAEQGGVGIRVKGPRILQIAEREVASICHAEGALCSTANWWDCFDD